MSVNEIPVFFFRNVVEVIWSVQPPAQGKEGRFACHVYRTDKGLVIDMDRFVYSVESL